MSIIKSDPLPMRVDTYLLRHKQKEGDFVPLEEVAKVLRGYTPGWHDYTESGIPILKVRNLTNRFINLTFQHRGFVPETIYENHPDTHIQLYDILVTASAHKSEYIAKKVDIVDILPSNKCMAVAELLIIRPDPQKIDPFYLLSVLRVKEINDQFRSCIKGTTAHIYPDDIAKKVFVPRLSPEREKEIGGSLKEALKSFRKFESKYSEHTKILFTSLEGVKGKK